MRRQLLQVEQGVRTGVDLEGVATRAHVPHKVGHHRGAPGQMGRRILQLLRGEGRRRRSDREREPVQRGEA